MSAVADGPYFRADAATPEYRIELRMDRRHPDVESAMYDVMHGTRPDLCGPSRTYDIIEFLRSPGDCALLPQLPDRDELVVCPVAYALARHADYDPIAMYALSRIGLFVGIVHPWWTRTLHVLRRGHTLTMRVPVAPGAVWYGAAGSGGWMLLDADVAGMPNQEIMDLIPALTGSKVVDFVTSPVLDGMDLSFTKVTVPDWNLISAHTSDAGAHITLRQATAPQQGRLQCRP